MEPRPLAAHLPHSARLGHGAAPVFTVVIPTFNRAHAIGSAIDSVLRQRCKEFELIVVDDGSTDDTARLLAARRAEFKVVRQTNQGVSAARNAGAAAARGRWLAFLDSDDQWDEDYLEVQKRHLSDDPRLVFQCVDCTVHAAAGSARTYFELNGAARTLRGPAGRRFERAFRFVLEHSPWQVGSVVIRTEAFRAIGGFDASLAISEDLDLLARLSTLGPARFVPIPLMRVYRLEEAVDSLSVSADRTPLRKREAHEGLYRKLEALNALDRGERRQARRARSANQRAIGNLMLDRGEIAAARWAFWRAFTLAPSLQSFGKLCLITFRR